MSLGLLALSLAAPLLLTGCGNFFVCEGKSDCPSSGSGTGTGTSTGSTTTDYAYVSNSTSGATYLDEYDLSAGKLTAISGSPFSLGYAPVALSVAPSDSFLYAATLPGATNPGIYLYSIGSDGALTAANSGNVLITADVSSMDISSDGNYLFVVSTNGLIMNEYKVNTSTGALTLGLTLTLPGTNCTLEAGTDTPVSQSCTVKVSPSGEFVAVALGTAGDAIFPYTSASGITSTSYTLISPVSVTSGDFSVTLDDNNYAYIARTDAMAVYSIASTGAATLEATATYTSGSVPRSVVLSTSQGYVYTANEGASTISGYSIGSSGALTQVTNSPFTGPTEVSALGVDKSGGYLIAAGYDSSNGVQLFSMSSGVLSLVDSTGSGTSTAVPAVLALTH